MKKLIELLLGNKKGGVSRTKLLLIAGFGLAWLEYFTPGMIGSFLGAELYETLKTSVLLGIGLFLRESMPKK